MADSFKKDSVDKVAEIQKVKKELATCQTRLDNAQTLMLDGALEPTEYKAIKSKFEPEIGRLTRQQIDLNGGNKEEKRNPRIRFPLSQEPVQTLY